MLRCHIAKRGKSSEDLLRIGRLAERRMSKQERNGRERSVLETRLRKEAARQEKRQRGRERKAKKQKMQGGRETGQRGRRRGRGDGGEEVKR